MSQIVPRAFYANAATWNSTFWHIASVLGPSLAGILIAVNYTVAYTVDISFIVLAFFIVFIYCFKTGSCKG